MVINKIGQQHIDYGLNCQDYGIEMNGVKIVCDGCSEGKHSEVGAKTFCHLMTYGNETYGGTKALDAEFQKMVEMFGQTPETVRDFLCFTILMVIETDDEFIVPYCGDGFIIEELLDGEFIIEELSDGEYPKYYAYNYVGKGSLTHYKDGVEFQIRAFPKSEYKNIGVASDGIRFAKSDPDIYAGFIDAIRSGKEVRVKRFINKHQSIFKDDTTIVF
jgi:hypothetical protein